MSGRQNQFPGAAPKKNENENFIATFVREQILDPQTLAGNLNVAFNVGVFGAAVYILQNYGDLLAL
jgi:hypothetical protein